MAEASTGPQIHPGPGEATSRGPLAFRSIGPNAPEGGQRTSAGGKSVAPSDRRRPIAAVKPSQPMALGERAA